MSPQLSSACRVFALLASLLTPRRAAAEAKLFVELDYGTDAALKGCPSDTAFRGLVQEQLGFDPFRPRSTRRIVARAFAADPGVEGFVRWYDASGAEQGERRLSSASDSCSAFVHELSFAIAVQIQLLGEVPQATEAVQPESPASPTSEPATESRNSAQPGPPPAPEQDTPQALQPASDSSATQRRELTRWQISAGAGPALTFRLAPQPAFFGRGFLAVRRDRIALELAGNASLPVRYTGGASQGFELSFVRASLAACGFMRVVSACIVNHWGRVAVSGFGVDVPRASSGFLAQVGPRLVLSGDFTHSWSGSVWTEVLVSLSPWAVTLNDRAVWETPRVSLALGADLAAVFHDNP